MGNSDYDNLGGTFDSVGPKVPDSDSSIEDLIKTVYRKEEEKGIDKCFVEVFDITDGADREAYARLLTKLRNEPGYSDPTVDKTVIQKTGNIMISVTYYYSPQG